MLERVDRLADAMQKQTGIPGVKVTRTHALKVAAEMGLEQAEATFAITPKRQATKKR